MCFDVNARTWREPKRQKRSVAEDEKTRSSVTRHVIETDIFQYDFRTVMQNCLSLRWIAKHVKRAVPHLVASTGKEVRFVHGTKRYDDRAIKRKTQDDVGRAVHPS